MKRLNKITRGAIAVAGAMGMVLTMTQARAFADGPATGLLTSYFDDATSVSPSASGYGGAGSSGGAGDGLVRTVNPTHFDSSQNGTLCAMYYVFDDIEEMQACCGCPVTPDGLRTQSVINNLTLNFGVNHANLNAGVIDIVSEPPNFRQTNPFAATPAGIHLAGNGGFGCDPSSIFGSTGIGDSSGVGTDLDVDAPAPGLRAWMSHTEANSPVPASTTFVKGVTVEEFSDAIVDPTHVEQLASFCDFLLRNGSGTGTCSCGSGDSNSTHKPR